MKKQIMLFIAAAAFLTSVNCGSSDDDASTVTDRNWTQDAYLKASNAEADDWFGRSVAISGDTIVVGAENEASNQTIITNTDGTASADNSAADSGAVYVFKR